MSGGKDSTALALLAIERGAENYRFVFADTGHEHQQTYEYVSYLEQALGITIDRVKADFSDRIAAKRELVQTKWADDGVPADQIEKALSVLVPSGNPFLDLCLWKGRFPGTRTRFCSEELKHKPINAYMDAIEGTLISWQGVRRDESAARRDLAEKDVDFGSWEPEPQGRLIYRPILDWTVDDVFAMHKRHGIEPNPLYKQGMGRVGCMPCIHARKAEMREIAQRFPDELARVAEWERLVSAASKRGASTFMDMRVLLNAADEEYDIEQFDLARHGIAAYADWANTARGGRQRDLIHAIEIDEGASCQSLYGLCE